MSHVTYLIPRSSQVVTARYPDLVKFPTHPTSNNYVNDRCHFILTIHVGRTFIVFLQ